MCSYAATGGNIELLKWVRECECPWSECRRVAKRGDLEMLIWARENDCDWEQNTCNYAAREGHLEVLKWAKENDCPFDENVCQSAVRGDHFELLKWAVEHGCPLVPETLQIAERGGNQEIIQYLKEKGCGRVWYDPNARAKEIFARKGFNGDVIFRAFLSSCTNKKIFSCQEILNRGEMGMGDGEEEQEPLWYEIPVGDLEGQLIKNNLIGHGTYGEGIFTLCRL